MSEIGILKIEKRENPNSRTSKKLRKEGYLPGSISGKGKDSVSVSVKAEDLKKGLSQYGRNALFKLTMKDDTVTGMVKDIQVSPVKGNILHVDFQQVSLNEEIRADLTIVLKGADTLEFKKLMPLRQLDVITVKGLPQHIPDDVVIDVSDIDKVENVYLKDVKFPEGIVPEGDPEQIVISIVETKRTSASSDEDEDETENEGEELL
jgi:large subunit ribosomal protein L25